MRDKIGKTVRGKMGRYKIVRELGHGGMGVLFEAKNIKTKKEVVIKFALEGEGEKTNKEKLTREIDILRTFQTTKPKRENYKCWRR